MKKILIFIILLGVNPSWADSNENNAPVVTNLKWKTECGACHLAFPPSLLPERSWRKIMTGLERHFGQDASLDELTAREITTFLNNNSAERSFSKRAKKVLGSLGPNEAPLRITETSWFIRKHDEVSAPVWKRPKVGSASNCAACHPGAEKGDYSERGIRIPG